MTQPPAPAGRVLVARAAMDQSIAAGRAALPRETGGILIGFRDAADIVVSRLLLVPDRASSGHAYMRSERDAQAALALLRQSAPTAVGYVGEWHTHPADQGPSPTDLHSLSQTARDAGGPIALMVVSFSGSSGVIVHVRAARRTRGRLRGLKARVDVWTSELTVLDEAPDELETQAGRVFGP